MELYVAHLPASTERLDEYRRAQAKDHICSSVIKYCRNGWPEKNIEAAIKPYWKARGELTVDKDNLLLYNKRIVNVVPKPLQDRHSKRFTLVTREFKDADFEQTPQSGGQDSRTRWRTW